MTCATAGEEVVPSVAADVETDCLEDEPLRPGFVAGPDPEQAATIDPATTVAATAATRRRRQ
jgi:hypothetical protein